MQHALGTITPTGGLSPDAAPEPEPRYRLLQQLQGGLRSDVWLALGEGGSSLADVVLLKIFVPHVSGPALDALTAELDLARNLSHENLAPTLQVGVREERHFIVKQYLEGATLQALLRWAELGGVRLAGAVVARVLAALVALVDHAERLSHNVAARLLSRQPIAVDDVFITRDGNVQVLGLKMPFGEGTSRSFRTATSVPAAIDELLAGHLSPELGVVLARASRSSASVRAFERLRHMGEALRGWQVRAFGSDGRAELAGVLAQMPPSSHLERRQRLEVMLGGAADASGRLWPEPLEGLAEEAAPLSGFRRVGQGSWQSSSSVRRRTAAAGGVLYSEPASGLDEA
jgi:hypothetical protein